MSASRDQRIDFAAGTSGTGPATWGQHAIWDVVRDLGSDAPRYNVSVGAPVTPGLPADQIFEMVRGLLHLHESLRTRLRPDAAGRLEQILDADGGVPVVVRECVGIDDVEEEGRSLLADLAALPFDFAGEWPIRVGLVEIGGLIHHIAFSLSHTASDAWGMRRMAMNLISIATGESVEQIRELRPSLQPLAEAEFQASDRGQRRDATARQYWAKKLRLGPRQIFPTEPGERLPFPHALFNSPALLQASEYIAGSLRVSSSSVLLAAASAMVSRISGSSDAAFQVVVNNRFLPGLTHAVSTIAQEGFFVLPNADQEFSDVARRTQPVLLAVYRNAYYDKGRLDRDIAALVDEGPTADRTCFFNDARNLMPQGEAEPPSGVPLQKLKARTTLRWPTDFEPRTGVTLALDVLDAPGSIELSMAADPTVIPRADMERFLHGVEEIVVAEALAVGAD